MSKTQIHRRPERTAERRGLRKWPLLAANYAFLQFAQARSVLPLIICTLASFLCAQALQKLTDRRRTICLAAGQICIFGILFFYKYISFFSSIILKPLGCSSIPPTVQTTPAGLSFFTFAASGYLFDVYRQKCPVEKNIVNYAIFLSFFPAILAGPINRARDFLPQLKTPAQWSVLDFRRGLLRVVTGGVKKWVFADALGVLVNTVYADVTAHTDGQLLTAVIAYSLQIYIDFAAYSDIAIGTAEMLGFRLTENFHAPYFSRTVQTFWKKWHISLTNWFREYLYFPLGGGKRGKARQYCNILIVFAASGLWHGASWTFLAWGLLNGFMQIGGIMTKPLRKRLHHRLHIPEDGAVQIIWQGIFTFVLMTAAWVFFRAESLGQAVYILRRIGGIFLHGLSLQTAPLPGMGKRRLILTALGVLTIFAADLRKTFSLKPPHLEKNIILFYYTVTALLLFLAVFGNYGPEFQSSGYIYFQF